MLNVGDRVCVVDGSEDGGDDHLIGQMGTVQHIEDDYAEVEIDGHGEETYLLGLWQLQLVLN